jgi:hypothetical protein
MSSRGLFSLTRNPEGGPGMAFVTGRLSN